MKNLILALPLILAPSCRFVEAVAAVPGAAVNDVGDVLTADEPTVAPVATADQATAERAGGTVGTIVTLGTGNPALGAGVGAVVALGVGLFLKRRKQAA